MVVRAALSTRKDVRRFFLLLSLSLARSLRLPLLVDAIFPLRLLSVCLYVRTCVQSTRRRGAITEYDDQKKPIYHLFSSSLYVGVFSTINAEKLRAHVRRLQAEDK